MMKHYVRLACFVGGALFGSAGVKLLTSKDAKKAYTHITAAGLRMKDCRRHSCRRQGHQRGPGRQGSRGSGRGPGGLKDCGREPVAAPFFHEERFLMKATIVHESRGRMRLRLRQKTMTFRQADLLETWLKAQSWTKEAVVHERTCCVIVAYAGERETVLSAIGGFTWTKAEESVTLPSHSIRELNREFQEKLVGKVLMKGAAALFLPAPLRVARC